MPITLNSVSIYPSDAPKKKSKIGEVQVTANGGRSFIHRTTAGGVPIYKSQWDLKFDDISEANRAAIEALANIATSMPYVDQHGTTYTVQTEEDAYSDSVSSIAPSGALYYNVSLTLYEV